MTCPRCDGTGVIVKERPCPRGCPGGECPCWNLFYRTKTKMIVGDTLANREAEKILKKGGVVLLTIASKPYSTLRLNKKQKCYEETLLKA